MQSFVDLSCFPTYIKTLLELGFAGLRIVRVTPNLWQSGLLRRQTRHSSDEIGLNAQYPATE
jgi:hypothetical protein